MNSIVKSTVAALCLGVMTSASAYIPATDIDADIIIRHSGASASSQSLIKSVVQLCDAAGDNHVFESELGGSGDPTNFFDVDNRHDGDYFVVACEVAAAGTAAIALDLQGAGTGTGGLFKMLYYKRDPGGSAMGVQPLATDSDVGYMSAVEDCPAAPTDAWVDCADTPTPGMSYVGPSHVGTSDVEPEIFTAFDNTSSEFSDWNNDGISNNLIPTNAQIAALDTQVSSYLTYGVPANYRMYTALQYAQFPTGHPEFNDCNPGGSNYGDISVDIDSAASEKCMPNLSKQQINSLFVRNRSADLLTELFAPTTFGGSALQSVWDFVPATSTISQPYGKDSYAALGSTPPEKVVVCRRTEGSGTGAQHMLFYHNYPCDRNSTGFGGIDVNLAQPEAGFGFNGVRESTSSGHVSDCLLAFDDGSNPGNDSPNPGAAKMAALGVQSAARSENGEHNWRYIKIDGHAPSLKNAHAGKYEQVYAQTWQTASFTSGNELNVVNALLAVSSTPSFVNTLNNDQSFGRVGWLANGGSGKCVTPLADTCTPTQTLDESLPVYPFVRESNGGAPNSCSIPKAADFTGGIGIGD